MAFQRPVSAFRNILGSAEFPFETDRYILYVALACPWANGVLQVARLQKLADPLIQGANVGTGKLRVAVVHPTWQYTDPGADSAMKDTIGLAAGVGVSEPHAGWVFTKSNQKLVPLAALKNASRELGLKPGTSAQEICASGSLKGKDGYAPDAALLPPDVIAEYGVASAYSTLDPSPHACTTLRHLYEASGGFMAKGVRATTPMLYDTKTDRIVSNESTDLVKFFNTWGQQQQAEDTEISSPDLYPEALRGEIDAMVDWVYAINNGVYRCGFSVSQPAYDAAAEELETRMMEVDQHLRNTGSFLVGDSLTIVDIRLFNTLIRMDEVYVAYFKCYFGSLFAPFHCTAGVENTSGSMVPKFPNLLQFTARIYNECPEIRETVYMDDIRNHYFTSHAIRNSFGVVPREVGVLRELAGIPNQLEKSKM